MDNIGSLIVPAAIALFAISIVARGIRIVQQAQTMIIERLGKYHRTLSSGVNLIIPIIDKPRAIDWHQVIVTPAGESFARHFRTDKIDLRETVYVFPRQNVITKDNVVVEIDALIYSQITDPVRATYEIANLPDAIEKLTQTTLRNVIGEMELDHVLSSRDTINAKLREILDEATHKWGAKVSRVELKDINPPRDIRDAMEKQMRAERDRRAAILPAEAAEQSRTRQAEGIRQPEIKQAERQEHATIVAGQVGAPRHLAVAPNGDLFVALAGRRGGAGGILALRDTSGDGKADVQQTIGTEGGTGIALGKGALYFGTASTVYRYAMRVGSLAPLGAPDVIVKDLPVGGHSAKNLALAPDGRTLFVNIGSATNSCQVADRSNESRGEDPCPELAYRAGVWRFDATQLDQTRLSGTRFATGIRNAVGLTFAPSGELYATQHGRDQLGQNWSKLF